MVKRATMDDFDFVKSVLTHPQIRPFINDDGCADVMPDSVITLAIQSYCLIPDNIGCFIFRPINSVTLEAHISVLPEYRGKIAVSAFNSCFDWVKDNTGFKKVMGFIPEGNLSYALCHKVGFKKEGLLTDSFVKNGVIKGMILMGKEV